ncbi:MAG: chromosomal replication initiator protein DnaA [Bacteroidaceae bacterium]|nr:chromosomal replication initiator protein DnaA [Bacteroidaceae bacterium]
MEQSPQILWEKCLDFFRSNITPEKFNVTFGYTTLESYSNGKLILNVPSSFIRDMLEKDFQPLMRASFKKYFGDENVKLYYRILVDKTNNKTTIESQEAPKPIINGTQERPANVTPDELMATAVDDLDSQLKPEYNFENYLEGESNRLARSVGEAIAKTPSRTFNPFFVFGPSGCGKTHLINAVGLRIKDLHPRLRVLYLSAHLFTVQYTDAVRNNKVNDFIGFYQTIDVLILDDIQELSGKTGTQNTFFHIFNHLQMNNKQIILAADRPPMAIEGLEDRLLTRFKWGLQAEIEKPTKSLRCSILNAKVQKEGLSIPESVINYISENIDESVRDLEGIINSLLAFSIVYKCEINMKLVNKVMPRFAEVNKKESISIDKIKEVVCNHFNVTEDDLCSRNRQAKIAYVRQMAMYVASKHTSMSNVQIGVNLGNRNHATVLHALNQVKNLLDVDEQTRQELKMIEDELAN